MERNHFMKKRVLVYPCGTEIGLEIYRALRYSTRYELYGGSSSYDHGRFVYEKHIDNLPFITDNSNADEIIAFNNLIKKYDIDFVFPAMDGVIYKFSEYRKLFDCNVICCVHKTNELARSKKKTYNYLKNIIAVPYIYENMEEIEQFPLFSKPDIGQGAVGAKKIHNVSEAALVLSDSKMLLTEYLPGEEYTVDCFTNTEGKLIFSQARTRKRIKQGISVNSVLYNDYELEQITNKINEAIDFKGAWFYQVKKDYTGKLKLLEIASRIAGASSYTRALGINLPSLTLDIFNEQNIDNVLKNNYIIEQDRALYNEYKSNLTYSKVYTDYDDTITVNGQLNLEAIEFIIRCKNEKIPVVLLSKHDGDLSSELSDKGISGLFDEIIHIGKGDEKYKYITEQNAIFIDDSYGERKKVYDHLQINTFEPSMFEFLLHRK